MPFAANIDDVRPERDADTEADQQQRRRANSGVGKRVDAAERAAKERGVTLERIRPQQKQHHRAQQQS